MDKHTHIHEDVVKQSIRLTGSFNFWLLGQLFSKNERKFETLHEMRHIQLIELMTKKENNGIFFPRFNLKSAKQFCPGLDQLRLVSLLDRTWIVRTDEERIESGYASFSLSAVSKLLQLLSFQ